MNIKSSPNNKSKFTLHIALKCLIIDVGKSCFWEIDFQILLPQTPTFPFLFICFQITNKQDLNMIQKILKWKLFMINVPNCTLFCTGKALARANYFSCVKCAEIFVEFLK